MPRYTPLNVHSHYSLLSALPKIPDLVKHAKKLGCASLALTDNGNLYGAIEFYKECKKTGIKPIIGMHAYMAIRSRADKQAGVDNKRHRIILLAKNEAGYKNLIKLSSRAHTEGFYYKPRIDRELLTEHAEGLIAILPAFDSDIQSLLSMRDEEALLLRLRYYRELFGDNGFYFEVSRHPEIDGHNEKMEGIAAFGKKSSVPLVASQEVYYLLPEEKKARETLLLVNSQGEPKDFQTDDADFSFPSPDKIEELFRDMPDAIENTERIAAQCSLELSLGNWVFPDYKTKAGASYDEELRGMVLAGIERRGVANTPALRERVEYELGVIKSKGYAPYFLVVADLLRFAHAEGILTTIRGSVAGSMVTYLAGITNVDPFAYKLPFERFLNPERPSPPDIDMDFADNRRDEMILYAKRTYGEDKVAQIGTFGTMMARGSVRDVARALGFEYSLGDRIAKLIPFGAQGFPMSIERALELVPELGSLYKNDDGVKTVIDMAKKIEGCARHISVHAAGVVISPTPLTDFVPLQLDPKGGKLITQYDMHAVEDAGLLKFDFLGIKNLSILADAVLLAKKIENKEIDIEHVPLDDARTFEMLARGETGGLFQLNGGGMTRHLKELRPSSIHDINAMVALYRPGPMENIPQYIERKHNPMLVQYLDPRLKDILADSYGVITYQDDVLLIAIRLAGFSWLEADKLRKAMGKKIPAEMKAQREKLIAGFIKGGLSKDKAERLWILIEPFAAYGFNKCVSGDTELVDMQTGSIWGVKELHRSNKQIELLTLNAHQKLEARTVSMVRENGVKTVFELTTRTGRRIRTTGNHPFLTINGWRNLSTLVPGERIAATRIIPSMPQGQRQRVEAYKAVTLGYLLSEGNLCHPNGVYFYSAQEDEIEDFTAHAIQFPNVRVSLDRSKSATAVYCGQIDQKHGNSIRNWISQLGLRGKKATEKDIPPEIFTWNAETLSILIGKMWQGDGCVAVEQVQLYYATSSSQLAHHLQHLLLRLGIISTVHEKTFKYRGGEKMGYTVHITHRSNIIRFTETAGQYVIGAKQEKLKLLCALAESVVGPHPARGTKDIIPSSILETVRAIMLEKGMTVRQITEITGLSERLLNFDSGKVGYQRSVILALGEALDSPRLRKQAESDIYWDEIVSIKKTGKEMTYDITLPPHHNFVANDIVIHNSHAASYGKVAYQTAYMKANFPAIYMSAVLTADSGDVEKIGEIIGECARMKIPVLPPSINESHSGFTVVKPPNPKSEARNQKQIQNQKSEALNEDEVTNRSTLNAKRSDCIRFGLMTIKNFGEGISHAIIAERKRGDSFTSLSDFLERVKDRNLNKKSLEALIKAGALDELGERGQMLANIETLLLHNKQGALQPANQDSLFGSLGGVALPSLRLASASPATIEEKLAWEKELLGLYISGHPLDKFRETLQKREFTIRRIKDEFKEGMTVVIGGIVEGHKPIITKKNDLMAFLRVADLTSSIEVVVFPKVYEESKKLLAPESCVAIKGRYSTRNGVPSLIAEKIKELK